MRLNLKLILINVADAVLLNAAVIGALALRFEGEVPTCYLQSLAHSAIFYTVAMLLTLNLTGVNRSIWRYAGVPTLLVLIRTLFFGFAVFFVVNLVPQVRLFPASVVILSWILATGAIVTSRLAWKQVRTPRLRSAHAAGTRILVVGAGDIGAMLVREMRRRGREIGEPVGFVDDDPGKLGRRIEDLPVLGTTIDIPRLLAEKRIRQVLIAAPTAPSRLVRQVVQFRLHRGQGRPEPGPRSAHRRPPRPGAGAHRLRRDRRARPRPHGAGHRRGRLHRLGTLPATRSIRPGSAGGPRPRREPALLPGDRARGEFS